MLRSRYIHLCLCRLHCIVQLQGLRMGPVLKFVAVGLCCMLALLKHLQSLELPLVSQSYIAMHCRVSWGWLEAWEACVGCATALIKHLPHNKKQRDCTTCAPGTAYRRCCGAHTMVRDDG
jgi:hypothetical protein